MEISYILWGKECGAECYAPIANIVYDTSSKHSDLPTALWIPKHVKERPILSSAHPLLTAPTRRVNSRGMEKGFEVVGLKGLLKRAGHARSLVCIYVSVPTIGYDL